MMQTNPFLSHRTIRIRCIHVIISSNLSNVLKMRKKQMLCLEVVYFGALPANCLHLISRFHAYVCVYVCEGLYQNGNSLILSSLLQQILKLHWCSSCSFQYFFLLIIITRFLGISSNRRQNKISLD